MSSPSPALAQVEAPAHARAAVVAAGMCAFFTMYVTQGLLPSLRSVFHAGVAELSLTLTATTLAVAAAAPLAGSLSDRFGRRPVLLAALCGLRAWEFFRFVPANLSCIRQDSGHDEAT